MSLRNNDFAKKITDWYKKNKRDLPWRNTHDPYAIWLSEVILQQTRVAQGLPYYERFINTFPTIFDLASASDELVLRLWQGLGYYSRARNMHHTAQWIVENLGGNFPETYQSLLALKGIGPYTAAAIASFAFQEAVPVIDGNVYRVLARYTGNTTDIASSSARATFTDIATELLPNNNAAEFNQAIMELGALQCTPKSPNCESCPLKTSCFAFEHTLQGVLPAKSKKTKTRNRFFNYIIFRTPNGFYLKKRGTNDIWEGLYDFYLVETNESCTNFDSLGIDWLSKFQDSIEKIDVFSTKKHVLSHQNIHPTFWFVQLKDTSVEANLGESNFYMLEEILDLPKPILIANVVENKIKNTNSNEDNSR